MTHSVTVEVVPVGRDAKNARSGDFILAHRRGPVSAIIRWGERVRLRSGSRWSHVAYVETPDDVIEALTRGVRRNPIVHYRFVEYVLVRTDLGVLDAEQATRFAQSCVGQRYGWGTILGIVLRFLTPGRGLWLGMDGTEICSGLVAQALCRGWANFKVNPATMTPAELAEAYDAPVARSDGMKPDARE